MEKPQRSRQSRFASVFLRWTAPPTVHDSWDNSTRKILRHEMNRLRWNMVLFALVMIDIIFIILQITISSNPAVKAFWLVSIWFGIIFMIEIAIRLYAFGVAFFRDWLNLIDAVVVIVTFILLVVLSPSGRIASAVRILRVVLRFLRFLVICWRGRGAVSTTVREVVTSNKQRFVDGEFNLDLAYVTDRVIVMSKPAIDLSETIYRNKLEEVARFFNTKHRDHYKVVNCCAEYEYPSDEFHGNVWRFPVEDHNCPTIDTITDFCEQAKPFMEESDRNVLGIHCKGGKGRSGTMVCCWLLYNKDFPSAEAVMKQFGERRTDQFKKGKVQGVETASQVRYVRYWERLVKSGNTRVKCEPIKLKRVKVKMDPKLSSSSLDQYNNWRIRVLATNYGERLPSPPEKGSLPELTLTVIDDMQGGEGENVFSTDEDVLLCGDTKLAIVANGDQGKEFIFYYFWFHTYFIENNFVAFEKHEVDGNRKMKKPPNPFKSWKSLRTELYFQQNAVALI